MIWPLIIISYLSLFVFGITDNVRGPLFSEILNYFQVSNTKGSILFAISAIAGLIVSLMAIFLLKNISRKKLIIGSALLMIISLIGLGWAQNFNLFVFSSLLFGMASGMLGLFPNILVPIGSTEIKRQQMISGLHAMYGISSFIAPLIVTLVYSYFPNYKYVFLFLVVFPLSLIVYTLKVKTELLELNRSTFADNHFNTKSFFNKKTILQIFLALSLSFTVIAEVMLSSRLSLFMQVIHNKSIADSSLCLSLFFFLMLLGRFFFAIKKFRVEIPVQLTILGLFLIITIFLGVMFNYYFLILSGLFVSPFFPLMATFIAEEFPKDLDQAMAIVIGLDSIMLTLMHLFTGKMTDSIGIKFAILCGCVFVLISISILLLNSYKIIFKKIKN